MRYAASPIAEVFNASMADIAELLVSTAPGGRLLRGDGACAMVTGIPAPALNGVWTERADPDVAGVAALIDEVSGAGPLYSLRLRSGSDETVTGLASDRGMVLAEELTLMTLEAEDSIIVLPEPAGLAIRQIAPEEAPAAATVGAAGFEVPEDVFLRAVSPDLLRLASVRCYVGEVAGEAMTTSLSVTVGVFTGIFCVATVPGWRGRGFGTAITARAITDALAAGSRWCWLEATAAGLTAYRTVGFQAIEPRQLWVGMSTEVKEINGAE